MESDAFLPRRYLGSNRLWNKIHCFAQALPPIRKWCVSPVKQRVLRKADENVRYVGGAGGGSAKIEFAVPYALFQEASQQFLSLAQPLLHDGSAKAEIDFKKFMAARRAVDDVGGCADNCADSFCGRPFLRSGGFRKVPGVKLSAP